MVHSEEGVLGKREKTRKREPALQGEGPKGGDV